MRFGGPENGVKVERGMLAESYRTLEGVGEFRSRPQNFPARAGFFARAHGRPDGVPGRSAGARGKILRRSELYRPSMTEMWIEIESRRGGGNNGDASECGKR